MINKKGIKNLILDDINVSIVLFEDVTSIDNVLCEYINEYKFFSEEAENFINENFEKESNEKTFNGIIYGLKNFETYGSKIFLTYEKGDYKTYLATVNKRYKKYIKENNFFIVPLGVIGIIITKDNKIIVAGKTKFCSYAKLVGGFVATKDIKDEQISILNTITREVSEEIGNIKLSNSIIIGAVLEKCCTFVTRHNIDYTSDEISEIYKKNKSRDSYEMSEMFFVDNNESGIKEAILNPDMNFSGKEALKFHLKRSFNNYEFYK